MVHWVVAWEPLIAKNVNLAPDSQAGRAQGFFDPTTQTVFLIADKIEAGTEQAVLAHERFQQGAAKLVSCRSYC